MKLEDNDRQLMFALLRTALWNRPLDMQVEDGYDWTRVLAELKSHSLLGITANAIMSLSQDILPNDIQQMDIFQHTLSLARNHHRLNSAIVEVYDLFHKHGVPFVLLKGQGLSALYPMQFTRSCGDIDAYVGSQHYEEACCLIDQYCGPQAKEASAETPCHYEIDKGKVKFEIHRKVTDSALRSKDKAFNKWADALLELSNCESVVINGESIATPSPLFNAVYIFDHMLRHFVTQGVGIRQFVDWALVLHDLHLRLDGKAPAEKQELYRQLKSTLNRFGIYRAWKILGGILVKDLGLPKEEFPLYSERHARKYHDRYARFVLDAGNLGNQMSAGKPSLLRRILPATFAPNFHLKHFLMSTFLLPREVFEHIEDFFSSFFHKDTNESDEFIPHKGSFSDPFRKLRK